MTIVIQSGANGDNKMTLADWSNFATRNNVDAFNVLAIVAGEADPRVIEGRKAIAAVNPYALTDAIHSLQGV